MRIQTNVDALNAYRNLGTTNRALSKSLERLSSGFRINRAADDAAGLAISEKMRGQIRGLNQAARNAQDGISLIQTAEGSLNETHAILQRMRELAVQAANDTLTANDRMEIQKEVDQLRTEIDRIANTTEFNTKKLLDGTTSALASTDRLETKVFMRDGLRMEDQFGQKAVGGGNFRLDITANPGTAQIQKTDIFKIKHGDVTNVVKDDEEGQAKAYFTGMSSLFTTGETITMQFVIDGENHTVEYVSQGVGEDTTHLAAKINEDLGHLLTAYGAEADAEQLDFINDANFDDDTQFTDANDLLLVLDGAATSNQTRFDFWVSDHTISGGGGIGTMNEIQTSYLAEDTFISGVSVGNPVNMILGDYRVDLGGGADEAEMLDYNDFGMNEAGSGNYLEFASIAENVTITWEDAALNVAVAAGTNDITISVQDATTLGALYDEIVESDAADLIHVNWVGALATAISDTDLADAEELEDLGTVELVNNLTHEYDSAKYTDIGGHGELEVAAVVDDVTLNFVIDAAGNSIDVNTTTNVITVFLTDDAQDLSVVYGLLRGDTDAVELLDIKYDGTGAGEINQSYTYELMGIARGGGELISQFRQTGTGDLVTNVEAAAGQDRNISLLLEVDEIDGNDITMTYRYHVTDTAGNIVGQSEGTRVLTANDGNEVDFGHFQFDNLELDAAASFTEGDRMLINAFSTVANTRQQITVNRDDSDGFNATVRYGFDHTETGWDVDTPATINFYQLNEDTGEFTSSEVTINFAENAWGAQVLGLGNSGETIEGAATFTIGKDGIGQIANLSTKIYDIDRFWDASGNFLVEDPQTITLVQGDGTKAAFTIFRDDTIEDVVNKIDAAIRNEKTNFAPGTVEAGKGLGQGVFDPGGQAKFAYYVETGKASTGGTFDTVEGTIVINSAIAGKFGEIKFIGDEDVIKALSLSTIREAEENRFTVDVINAHSGAVVAEDVTITSNILVGVVHSNVDVEFDPNANIAVGWQSEVPGEAKGDYNNPPNAFYFDSEYVTEGKKYETYVHLADNTMVYHIGANPLQDVAAAMGDMRSRALGVHNTLVVDRASANDSIRAIDNAIDRVSAERSKLGALQNRLEHTISNLAVASENLSAAESRIRDVDMAAEMMEFTKNQILAQAGTAMLAQANMKPQMVLQLLG